MLLDESNIVTERVNAVTVTEANLLQAAVLGVLSKKHRTQFTEMVGAINVETRVIGDDDGEEGGPPRLLPEGYEEG